MKYVEVVADVGHVDTVSAIAEQLEARDFHLGTVATNAFVSYRR